MRTIQQILIDADKAESIEELQKYCDEIKELLRFLK